ncbi:MAG: cytochrome c [Bacteroidetes bacterium]|nr:cytochrome c [Bacteroidota bacterium]
MKNKRNLILTLATAGIVVVVLFVLWAGNDFQALRSTEPPVQIRYDMQYQSKVGAQQPNSFFADRKSMRDHVPGTVPREGGIYPYTTFQEAEAELSNPFAGISDVLGRGKNRYNNFCAPCHSVTGQDTTEVVRKGLQKPPNLAAANAKGYTDAHLFHVISAGQNIMPGYADKLKPEDRWAIVNYVRELQKAPLKYAEVAKPAAQDSAATKDGGAAQNGAAAPAAASNANPKPGN